MTEMESVEAVGATARGSKFSKFTIQRNTCGPDDVTIDIKYYLSLTIIIGKTTNV